MIFKKIGQYADDLCASELHYCPIFLLECFYLQPLGCANFDFSGEHHGSRSSRRRQQPT
jgi:hypothetical protein